MERVHLLFTAIILIISISLHEYAHAWMANRLWDPTPKIQGRLTPSPLAHIDPIGFVLVFLVGFGRGRPVQYNPQYLRHPLKDELQIALAWPAMNIILTIGGMFVLIAYQSIFLAKDIIILWWGDLVTTFWMQFCFMNIALAVFNMIPMPPLDGYRLIKIFFPDIVWRIEWYGQYILLGFVLLFIRGPGSWLLQQYITWVSSWIFNFLYSIISVFL